MKTVLSILLFLAGLPSSQAFSEFGNISRKVFNPDGTAANGAKVIVIQRNTERSESPITTTGETNAQGVFSGTSLIPKHWRRGWVSTLVLGKGGEIAFDSKSYQLDKVPDAHPDITLTGSTALKTRIIDMNRKPVPNIRLRIEQIDDDGHSKRIPFSLPLPVLPDGIWSAVSDGEGRCVIDRVPPGLRFYLTHDDPSFAQPHGEMNIFVSWQTPMSDGDEYEILLTKPGSVSGRILFPDGSPAGMERAKLDVGANLYSDFILPARLELTAASNKLQAGDTNIAEHIRKAEQHMKDAEVWSREFIGIGETP